MSPVSHPTFVPSSALYVQAHQQAPFATSPALGQSHFIPTRAQRAVINRYGGVQRGASFDVGRNVNINDNDSGKVQETTMAMITPEVARIGIAVYGVLMAGGGIGAFLKSGSKPSVISGVSAGVVLAILYAKDNVQGALITACVLGVVFLARLIKTKKFIPAGLLLSLSILAAIFFATAMSA